MGTNRGRDSFRVGFAAAVALLIARDARASECSPPTPSCHLANGKRLLDSDPKRAAEELYASYQLDERTDTLALYAAALARDGRHAHALETWKRVILFREAELDSAKNLRGSARKAAIRKAQARIEAAAQEIIQLWPKVGRVRVRLPAGERITVWHDGVEVDPTKDVLVNAGSDELVFADTDGAQRRVTVEVAAGASLKLDAPRPVIAKPEPAKPAQIAKPAQAPEVAAMTRPEPERTVEPPIERPVAPRATPAAGLEARIDTGPRSRTMTRVGLGLVGGAVVAGGIAGGLAFLANRDYDDARTLGCDAADQCPVGPAADLAERSNDRARWAQIGAIGAGAMLATGVTLWIVGNKRSHRTARSAALRVGPNSVAMGWRF